MAILYHITKPLNADEIRQLKLTTEDAIVYSQDGIYQLLLSPQTNAQQYYLIRDQIARAVLAPTEGITGLNDTQFVELFATYPVSYKW